MKRLFLLLLAWAAFALPAHAADPLEGVVPLVKDDITAVAQAKAQPGRHVLLFFGDQLNWGACRYTVSVLRNPEVMAKYMKHYIGVHADFSDLQLDDDDPRHATVQRFNPRKWRPVIVFLNGAGEEVARHVGRVNSKEEALQLDRFITEKHYLKTDFKTYKEAAR